MPDMTTRDEVLAAALTLPDSMRAEIADALLQSITSEEQATIDALWAEEAESRIAAFQRGELKALPGPESLASLKARYAP